MKDIVKKALTSACVMFTAFMLVGSLIAMGFVGPEYGLVLTFTILLASVAFSVLQALWFTDKAIKWLSYPLRILGFGITAFLVLSGCAWLGDWFPMENGWAWVTFAIIYFVILVVCCIVFQIYFRRTVGSFDAALRQYHERMGR